jgi:hypothetical protein
MTTAMSAMSVVGERAGRGCAFSDASGLITAHESPRATKLYNRTGDEITLDEVERDPD